MPNRYSVVIAKAVVRCLRCSLGRNRRLAWHRPSRDRGRTFQLANAVLSVAAGTVDADTESAEGPMSSCRRNNNLPAGARHLVAPARIDLAMIFSQCT